jgi:hypothetical protein
VLIRKSKVIEIETDEKPFSHNIDHFDNGAHQRYSAFNLQQAMYNSIKKQSILGTKAPQKLHSGKDGEMKFAQTRKEESGFKP